MAKYLISFPGATAAMSRDEREAVMRDAHAVIDETKAAGVYFFSDDAFAVLELASREEAVAWAARIARSRRCTQKPGVFQFDPPSWRMFEEFLRTQGLPLTSSLDERPPRKHRLRRSAHAS